MITTKLETITPSVASKYLTKMVNNRPLSQSKSLEYAIAMDQNEWVINGETIKFDNLGNLFDGQHRLAACVLAEKPFKSYVIRGISDKMAFATVDVGRTRTHGDIFSLSGIPSPNIASGAAMLIYLIKNDMVSVLGIKNRRYGNSNSPLLKKLKTKQIRATTVTKEDLLKFCEPFKDRLIGAVRYAEKIKAGKLLTAGQVAACYFLFCEKSELDAKRFFADLCEGVGLSASDPVYKLRERLISNKLSQNRLTRFAVLFLVIKAWCKRRNGETVGTLKIVENEAFPKVI